MHCKILYPRSIAASEFVQREVGPAYAHPYERRAEPLGAAENLAQEGGTVVRAHLKQIIAARLSHGKPESIYTLKALTAELNLVKMSLLSIPESYVRLLEEGAGSCGGIHRRLFSVVGDIGAGRLRFGCMTGS